MSRRYLAHTDIVLMTQKLHLWVGMPQSPSELTGLLGALEKSFPAIKGRTQVVFENEILPIADLAAGFGNSESLADEIVTKAASLGWRDASAMIGAEAEVSVGQAKTEGGPIYLGAFDLVEG